MIPAGEGNSKLRTASSLKGNSMSAWLPREGVGAVAGKCTIAADWKVQRITRSGLHGELPVPLGCLLELALVFAVAGLVVVDHYIEIEVAHFGEGLEVMEVDAEVKLAIDVAAVTRVERGHVAR